MRTLVLACLATAACATAGKPPAADAASCETGTVGTFGPSPSPAIVLQTEAGRVELTGDLAPRVARLTGAIVTACGPRDGAGRVQVESFQLRKVDGMEAYLGTLRVVNGVATLDRGEDLSALHLVDVPDRLRASAGHEVWVAGAWQDGAFAVRSFGVLDGSAG